MIILLSGRGRPLRFTRVGGRRPDGFGIPLDGAAVVALPVAVVVAFISKDSQLLLLLPFKASTETFYKYTKEHAFYLIIVIYLIILNDKIKNKSTKKKIK